MTTIKTESAKFFMVNVYRMYDGLEFPMLAVLKAKSKEEAMTLAHVEAAEGEYSHGGIDEIEKVDGVIKYWSGCGEEVVIIKAVIETTEEVFNAVNSIY
ncbi:hypothetical protein [Burkholderia pseudomallei]|uniref:hypothetical protein n=1 Tax=Burkholderia pseudomallei TaxID=28450 RepID=UPI001060A3AF|nr:hypothetical protein [Burkholderia pseudomallei]